MRVRAGLQIQEKYPKTYEIIDASEIFIETPSDLHMLCSTWNNCKHHNTAKFLIDALLIGVISYYVKTLCGVSFGCGVNT